jgi:phosphoserine phosphatase
MNHELCKYHCYRNTREPNRFKNYNKGKIKMVIFDMDGVIANTISSWKYIHDYFGSSNERSVDAYLKGNIDDTEFIKRDVALWRDNGNLVTRKKLVEILSNVKLMRGAERCIKDLKENGVKTAIISAGLDILAERIAAELDIDYFYANGIKTDKMGRLNGEGIIGVRLMYKDHTVIKLSKKVGIPLEMIAAVGNSCFDIPMLEICGLGIAFNPEDNCIKNAADFVVDSKDLSKILFPLEKYI